MLVPITLLNHLHHLNEPFVLELWRAWEPSSHSCLSLTKERKKILKFCFLVKQCFTDMVFRKFELDSHLLDVFVADRVGLISGLALFYDKSVSLEVLSYFTSHMDVLVSNTIV